MGPEEILAALDEAITKVQLNVQTFENSCAEVGSQAAVLQGVYQEKTNDLVDSLMEIEPAVDGLKNELIASVIEKAEQVDEDVSSSIDEVENELEALIGSQLSSLTDAYEATHESALNFIDDTVRKTETAAGAFKQEGASYTETLEGTINKLSEIEEQVQNRLNAFIETVSQELRSAHKDTFDTANEFMDDALNSELVSFFSERDEEFVGLSGDLTDNLENMGESLSNKFSELSVELVDYTDSKATEEVRDIVNGMVDFIVGELASVISESIVKSTVGVSVTSATSPMLPTLIAFNKIYDALEGAIEAWKSFKESFGF